MSDDAYREACRRQHRVLGHFLAVQAWLRGLDCVVMVRRDLEIFLDLERFKSTRISWLLSDLKAWFPYQAPYYLTKSEGSLHSLFLSRTPIVQFLAEGSMTTEQRIKKIHSDGPKTARITKTVAGHKSPSESDVVRYLAILDSGLEQPTLLESVPYYEQSGT